MAVQLGWDPSKVSNIETGKARATEVDLAQYLATCGKGVDYLAEFRSRYEHAFDTYFAQVSDNLRTIAMTEAMATKITALDILTVHGLMQTRPYARALLTEAGRTAPAAIEEFVRLRMERQAIWQRQRPPECTFYIHELALQMRLGNNQVMEDQYLRLLFNTHVVRIVPANAMSAALLSKCTLYEFDKAAPVAYTESDLANVFAQDAAAITQSRKLFARLDAVALDEEQSRSKLADYVSGLREDHHERRTDLA